MIGLTAAGRRVVDFIERNILFLAAFFALLFWLITIQSSVASEMTTNGVNTNQMVLTSTNSPATNAPSSLFRDPLDGWFDASGFLDTRYGFIPIVLPITEPAVGYGGVGGLLFVDRNPTNSYGKPVQPNLTGVGGLGTQNGTWGVFGVSSAWWLDGSLHTVVGVTYATVNLKYYGLGDSSFNNNSIKYTLTPLAGLVEAHYRLGRSPWLAGLGYAVADTKVSFDGNPTPPGVNLPPSLDSHIGGLKPVVIYDTRDNLFTPTEGIYAKLDTGFYAPAFGSDTGFETVSPLFIFYLPLSSKWTLGVNTAAGFSFGDAPFYSRPFIDMRGVPIREYQADNMTQIEAELRWQFWKRYSVVGFTGAGFIWNDDGNSERSVVSGGVGLRYELARKYGLHLGADVGFSRNCTAFYLQVGSAWFRP
jgi:outer membrane protein assembly factor BamA